MGFNADTLDKDDLELDSMYFFEQDGGRRRMRFDVVLHFDCFELLLAGGMYFIFAEALHLPRIVTTKAVLNVARQDKKQTKHWKPLFLN